MRLKRIMSLLLAGFMMMTAMVVCAAADTMNDPVVTNSDRKVVISGTSIQPDGTNVAISVWYPNAKAENLGGDIAIKELNAYTGQTTVTGGNYTLTFYLKQTDTSGEYTAMVFIPGMSKPLSKGFAYQNEAGRDALVAAVKNTANGVPELIAAMDVNISAVNVSAGLSYKDYSAAQKTYVAQYVAAHRPTEENVAEAAASLSGTLSAVVTALDTVKALATGDRATIKKILDAEAADNKLQIDAATTTAVENALAAYDALTDEEAPVAIVEVEKEAAKLVTPEDVARVLLAAAGVATTPKTEITPSSPVGESSSNRDKGSVVLPPATEIPAETKPEATDEFSDLQNVLWAKNAINTLAARGAINGRGEGEFCPQDVITREEFLKLAVEALDVYNMDEGKLPFKDVIYGAWYYDAIAVAYSSSMIEGISEDAFGIGASITRQDMATILARILKTQKMELGQTVESITFADEASIADYAKDAVRNLSEGGIINGREDGSFDPQATATRAEAAVIIYRVMYRLNLL